MRPLLFFAFAAIVLAAPATLLALPIGSIDGLPEANVIYRETFPATAGVRGQNVLDQGWDIIRSRLDQLTDIVAGTAPDGVTPISQNSGAIFANGDNHPRAITSAGVNNSPVVPDGTPDGILFASSGFYPFLFFTEEVPAGTQASDVNSVLFRGRNNAGNASQASDPRNQSVHPVLKVDGAWYAHETGVVDPFPGSFNFFAVDFSAGNWAPLTVTNLDFTMGTIDSAELAGDFTLTKPSGAVEAWGLYNALLTGNTRFDMVEFRSDAIGSFMTPEPASAVMVGVAAVVAAARRRRAA